MIVCMPVSIGTELFLHPDELNVLGTNPVYIASCYDISTNPQLADDVHEYINEFINMLAGERISVGVMALTCALSCIIANVLLHNSGYEVKILDSMEVVARKSEA